MKVNLDRDGIIHQARLHIATAEHVIPLDEDADDYHVFAANIVSARAKRDVLSKEEAREYASNLAAETKINPLGRVAQIEKDLPTGKRLNVNLALLNESVGIMPAYKNSDPNIRQIGRANFYLENTDEHTHPQSDLPRSESILSAGFDILTDGNVNMTVASLEACKECLTVRLHDDSRIIEQIGIQALYHSRMGQLPPVSTDFGPYTTRTSRIRQQMLNDEQVSGLQSFLMEQFKPTKDS